MLARLTAFAVWALVAGSAVFWGLRLLARPAAAPGYTVAVGEVAAQRGDLTRLLGASPVAAAAAAPAAPELASRFKLLGVMAGKPPGDTGFATIAVDNKPARTYAVGTALDGDLVLQSVSLRSAAIGPAQGRAAVTLEIPPLPAPTTGTLPPAGSISEVARPVPAANLPPQMPPPPQANAMAVPPPDRPPAGLLGARVPQIPARGGQSR